MKIRFSILLLVIAVFVSSVISGCQYDKATNALNSNHLVSNQSEISGYYNNLSVLQKSVSADKIYDSSYNTFYSQSSSDTSENIDSTQSSSSSESTEPTNIPLG